MHASPPRRAACERWPGTHAKANPNYVPISQANAHKDLLKSSQNERSAQEALSENAG
jgi:hypothetical protein